MIPLAKAKALAAAIEALSTDTVKDLARELLTLLENASMAAAGPNQEVHHVAAGESSQRGDPLAARTTHEQSTRASTSATGADVGRGLSMTSDAVRARRRRAEAKAAQLDLFDGGRATAVAPVDPAASARPLDPTAVATAVGRPLSTTTDHTNKISSSRQGGRDPLDLDPEQPAAFAFDVWATWRELRTDLSEHDMRQIWWKFAKHPHKPPLCDEARASYAFGCWLKGERKQRPSPPPEPPRSAPTFDENELAPSPPPEEPPSPPESQQRPIVRPEPLLVVGCPLIETPDTFSTLYPFPRAPPEPRSASA